MSHYQLAFLGYGNVGRALTRLLQRKETELRERYNITFTVTGIATERHGFAIDPAGIAIEKALSLVESGQSLAPLSRLPVSNSIDFIRKCPADVLFENTPVNHKTGEPAIEHVKTALEQGMHVCTANKGTVVHGYQELRRLARAKGRKFYFESTVLGGSPVFSVFREALPAARLLSFQGILNSTTNVILSRMERGESFDDAVRYCQQIGLAETDPSADVDGWDAAIKVAALVTVLMDTPFTPQQVERTGIRDITFEMMTHAKTEGKRWKLVCSAERAGDEVKGRVAPELIPASSPLYNMEDSTTGVTFRTDVLGDLSIVESEREGMVAGPAPTAYGLLADFINMVK